MKIDKNSNVPIYIQIYNDIVDEIKNGYFIASQKLPSRRKLSIELDVSPQTIENAYQKLKSRVEKLSRDEMPLNEEEYNKFKSQFAAAV